MKKTIKIDETKNNEHIIFGCSKEKVIFFWKWLKPRSETLHNLIKNKLEANSINCTDKLSFYSNKNSIVMYTIKLITVWMNN